MFWSASFPLRSWTTDNRSIRTVTERPCPLPLAIATTGLQGYGIGCVTDVHVRRRTVDLEGIVDDFFVARASNVWAAPDLAAIATAIPGLSIEMSGELIGVTFVDRPAWKQRRYKPVRFYR